MERRVHISSGREPETRAALRFTVERGDTRPIYLQICSRFKTAVAEGQLRAGDRVPSVRNLASELGLSRGTVDTAYQLLAEEGYLSFRGAAGTFIDSHHASAPGNRAPTLAKPKKAAGAVSVTQEIRPLQLGLPALDAFPRKIWNRLVGRYSRSLTPAQLIYSEPTGHGPLRERIAAYLGLSRGISCAPDQVFVLGGHTAALSLILRAMSREGDHFWFEEPGYLMAREFLLSIGARLCPVHVDDEGLRVEHGMQAAPDARFALVTPANQSPLGVMMSIERRQQLLHWASEGERWIIEDDYDSEYRYNRRPPAPLKSMDSHDRVLYLGSFSKVLYPGLRLSYLIVPQDEIERFTRHCRLMNAGCPALYQAVVAEFMDLGHFSRHLKRMRGLYALRRRIFIEALEATFGDRLEIISPAAGLHVVASPTGYRASDIAIAARASEAGLGCMPLSPWYMGGNGRNGLLMGFANIAGAESALAVARRLEASCAAAVT